MAPNITGSRGAIVDPGDLANLQQSNPDLFNRWLQQLQGFASKIGITSSQTPQRPLVTGNVGMQEVASGSVPIGSTGGGLTPRITGDAESRMLTRGGVNITEGGGARPTGQVRITGAAGSEVPLAGRGGGSSSIPPMGAAGGGGGGGRRPPVGTPAPAPTPGGGGGKGPDLAGRYANARSSTADLVFGKRNEAGLRPGRGAMGGKTGAIAGSVETLLSGDPLGAIISAPVGLGAGQIANIATNQLTKGMMSAGPLPVRLAGAGLRFLAPGLVGYGAQQATAGGVRALTGVGGQAVDAAGNVIQGATGAVQSQGLGGLGGGSLSDLELPFIGPVGARAKARRQAEFEREQRRAEAGLEGELRRQKAKEDLDYARQEGQISTETYLNQMRGLAPLIEQQDRRRFTQQQALLNTQGSIYQSLGRQAGMFQLAGIGMQEAGAYARTAIAANPYAGSTIQAPQISFG